MAVSKHTCGTDSDTNQLFQTFFRTSKVPKEREQAWHEAVRFAGTGASPLRFPVYECLYSLNVHAQRMVELLEEVSGRFSLNRTTSRYHQSLIQYVRADVSRELMESLTPIEHTESWLFERLRRAEERRLFDPDRVYSEVRQREAARAQQGLPPLVKFLETAAKTENARTNATAKRNRSG